MRQTTRFYGHALLAMYVKLTLHYGGRAFQMLPTAIVQGDGVIGYCGPWGGCGMYCCGSIWACSIAVMICCAYVPVGTGTPGMPGII